MRIRAYAAAFCLALAAPVWAQEAPDHADTFLDIMVPPLTLRTTADTGELIELEISNTGFLELQPGDEVVVPDGSEAQLRLGTSAVGVAGNGPATRIRVIKAGPDRQTVTLNDVKLSMRDGTLVDVSTTSDGRAWAAMQYGSLNVYGPEDGVNTGAAIRLLSADLPRKFDAKLAKGQTLNLRVVDGKGTFTALAGKIDLADGDGNALALEEGQSVAADATQAGLTTTLTVNGIADEPITIQRGGEGGKLEQIDEMNTLEGNPITVDLKPNDLVSMGEGSRAEVKVGGSFVKLTEFTTFAVNALSEKVAQINVLGVDLELDTVTIIEVAYGSLHVDVESGTIRAVADLAGGGLQDFYITLPDGTSAKVEVPAGGEFQVSKGADGKLAFTNTGTSSVNVVVNGVSTPVGPGTSPSASSLGITGDVSDGTGGGTTVTQDTKGETTKVTTTTSTGTTTQNTNDPGAPIPGTNVVKDNKQGVSVISGGF